MKNHLIINNTKIIFSVIVIVFSLGYNASYTQTLPKTTDSLRTHQQYNRSTTDSARKTAPRDKTMIQQKGDTLGNKYGTNAKSKLTQSQINKIVGNDKRMGKDSQGHQLYQDSNSKRYYVSNTGTKVYVK